MSLQTDLQEAIARVQRDSQILHTIIHGDNQTSISTEGGNVKSAAKVIKDIEDRIQAELTNLGDLITQMNDAVDKTQCQTERAKTYAQNAENIVNGLTLPTDLTGHAGKLLAVKQNEEGYALIQSTAVFYGLRKEGAKLIAETGEGPFETNRFPVWVITLPGITFSLNKKGHLLINT